MVRERLGRLGVGVGVAAGVNTWLRVVVNGLSDSHMPRGFSNLLRSEREVTKLLKTARLGVW